MDKGTSTVGPLRYCLVIVVQLKHKVEKMKIHLIQCITLYKIWFIFPMYCKQMLLMPPFIGKINHHKFCLNTTCQMGPFTVPCCKQIKLLFKSTNSMSLDM